MCPGCLRSLPWLRTECCRRCALSTHYAGEKCPAEGAAFGAAWAPFAYEGVTRDLVTALKFHGALPLASLMAAHLAANVPLHLLDGSPVLVPVPPQPARARKRGFDPVSLLATKFAARRDLKVDRCLKRRDSSGHQSAAGRSMRRKRGRIRVELQRQPAEKIILIDDVYTTGATLEACARALVDGGARSVVAIAYARTL